MDNWDNNLWKWLNDVQRELESFSIDINQEWQKNITELDTKLNDLTEEVEDAVTAELNQFLEDMDDLMIDFFRVFLDEDLTRFEDDRDYDPEELYSLFEDYKPIPNTQKHPACVGCSHYHGQTYNGNLLVCAMYPYGWDGEKCPDWEKES